MTPAIADHAWIKRQLPFHAIGLLDEAEDAVVRSHLEGCATCREALDAMRNPAFPEDRLDGHLPVDLVSRWPRLAPRLEGLERQYVERHLKLCETCRDDLALLGFAPEIPVVAPQTIVVPVRAGATNGAPRPVPIRSHPRFQFNRNWVYGAVAVAATIVVVAILPLRHSVEMTPSAMNHSPAPPPVGPASSPEIVRPQGSAPPAPSHGGPVLQLALLDRGAVSGVVDFQRRTRSQGPVAMPIFEAARDTLAIPISRLLEDVRLDAIVRVEIAGPHGTVARGDHAERELFPDKTLVVAQPHLRAGEYVVRVTTGTSERGPFRAVAEFPFRAE